MFDRLSDGFNNVFRKLSGRAEITESNVREAMADVETALLEADVHYDVAKKFCDRVVQDAIGREVTKSLKPGQEMIGIVNERLSKDDVVQGGFLLDGFPRTPGQADALVGFVGDRLKLAINLDVAVEVVTERMMARGREDDTPESIARRLELYEAETAPLLSWAEDRGILHVVDGLGSEDEVFTRLQKVIETV